MRVLKEFISVYVVGMVEIFVRWFMDCGIYFITRFIVVMYYLLGVMYVGLCIIGIRTDN